MGSGGGGGGGRMRVRWSLLDSNAGLYRKPKATSDTPLSS